MQHYRPRVTWRTPSFVAPVQVDPAGRAGPTKGQARGPRWRRTAHGLYVPADVDPSVPEQRIVEAVGHLAPGGAVTGWAALRLHGAWMFDGLAWDGRTPKDVPLVMGPHQGRRAREGIRMLGDRVGPTTTVRGIPCVPVARALFDEMRLARGLVPAVVAADMTMLADLVTVERMWDFTAGHGGWAGVPLVRRALHFADPHSCSPQETRLRLLWEIGLKLPRPLCNVAVFDRNGVFLGYPDLLDPDAGLGIEYDGADHRSAARHSDDVDREARLRAVGLEVTRVTGRDLAQPRQLADRLRAARKRAPFLSPERRAWTLEPVAAGHYFPESS